jgi:hypothetical protein
MPKNAMAGVHRFVLKVLSAIWAPQMPIRRRFIRVGALAVAVSAAVYLLPALYWNAYGWARGEPFWAGRPASFWWREARANTIAIRAGRRFATFSQPQPVETLTFQFPQSKWDLLVEDIRVWSDRTTDGLISWRRQDILTIADDPASLKVLAAFAHNSDPKIRMFAVDRLAVLGRKYLVTRDSARTILGQMLSDDGVLDQREPTLTVGMAAEDALSELPP